MKCFVHYRKRGKTTKWPEVCEKYIHPMPTWFKEKITAQDIMLGT